MDELTKCVWETYREKNEITIFHFAEIALSNENTTSVLLQQHFQLKINILQKKKHFLWKRQFDNCSPSSRKIICYIAIFT